MVGVRLPEKLYELLQDYKEEKGFLHDSEALRDILRKYLKNYEKEKRN